MTFWKLKVNDHEICEMKISVIVTTYNRPSALKRVLDALSDQTCPADEVIVADDGSGKETETLIQTFDVKKLPQLLHVWHEDKGFRAAKIRNDAIRKSTGEYIILLDGDCIPNRHFVEDHLRLVRPGCFFQGKRVLVKKTMADSFTHQDANRVGRLLRLMLKGCFQNSHHLIRCSWCPPKYSKGLSGTRSCNMGFLKSDLVAVNGFNEAFRGWGREDTELVVRLYRYGLLRRTHSFMAICFHLWHPENSRESLAENNRRLQQIIQAEDYFISDGLVKNRFDHVDDSQV